MFTQGLLPTFTKYVYHVICGPVSNFVQMEKKKNNNLKLYIMPESWTSLFKIKIKRAEF